MPEISRFRGIRISVHFNEHPMPHFHARYAEHKVSVRICDGFVSGRFPARELRRVLEWYDLHRDELQAAWDLAQRGESPRPIAPME